MDWLLATIGVAVLFSGFVWFYFTDKERKDQ